MSIEKKTLEKVDVLYDDKKWGKRIDPDEWNANFKVLEDGHNKLVDSLTEQISDIDVAIESVTEEGGDNIKLQYRDNTETLNTAVGHIITDIDNRYTKLESDTLLAEGTNSLIKDVSYESNTGVFTITKKDGSKVVIDTVIEKVPASMALKEETDGSVWLVVTNQDGSLTKTNVTSLIEDTVIADSDTVVVSSSTDAVNRVTTYTLNIKPNSLGLNHFNSELVTKFEETQSAKNAAVEAKTSAENYAAQAKQSAQSAEISAESAGSYATNAANSAESAKSSETSASNSATEAAKSAIEAKKYAGTGNTEALVTHIDDKNNPHQVTKEQLGFYISDGEPTDAETGDVWLDTSLNPTEESGGSTGGGSTGGVSSWNDLTDKPFEPPKVYEFDGNTEGLDSFNDGLYNYYKISDDILTTEQLVGGTLAVSPVNVSAEPVIIDILSNISEGPGCIAAKYVYIVFNYQEMSSAAGVVIPSNGIYFAKTDNFTVTKLTTRLKTIDKAFLPPIDKSDLPAIEVNDLPSIPLSKIKDCPVVTFNISLSTFVGSSSPTFNVSYDGYTLDELLTCMQSGNVIFETSDGFRMFTITVDYNDTHLFVNLLVTYGQKLYSVDLAFKKSNGSVFRNNLKTFTAV